MAPGFDQLAARMGANLIAVLRPTIDPLTVPAISLSEQVFAVPGLAADDIIINVVRATFTPGIGIVGGRVVAANQAAIVFLNATGSPVDLPAEPYAVVVLK